MLDDLFITKRLWPGECPEGGDKCLNSSWRDVQKIVRERDHLLMWYLLEKEIVTLHENFQCQWSNNSYTYICSTLQWLRSGW